MYGNPTMTCIEYQVKLNGEFIFPLWDLHLILSPSPNTAILFGSLTFLIRNFEEKTCAVEKPLMCDRYRYPRV